MHMPHLHFILFLTFALVLGYAQSRAWVVEGYWHSQVDLLPIWVAYAAVFRRPYVLGFCLVAGIWVDLLSANPLGTSWVSWLLTILCLQRVQGVLLRGHWIGEAMLCALASAMSLVFGAALLWMGRHHPMLGWPFAWQALFNASVCALGGPMAFILLRALDRLLLAHPLPSPGYHSVVEVKRGRFYRSVWK